ICVLGRKLVLFTFCKHQWIHFVLLLSMLRLELVSIPASRPGGRLLKLHGGVLSQMQRVGNDVDFSHGFAT
ncbi:MAG: hypothetical protein ACLQSW_04635, partial [Syntrophobacteraceae bacterium]